MRWPLGIEANRTTDEVVTTMDLLPTIAAITRCNLPDQIIDGKDVSPILFNELGARTPHEMIYFYKNGFIQAVRYGKWKLHFEHGYQTIVEPGVDGKHGVSEDRVLEPSLYDLDIDPGETKNLASEHPDLVKEMVKRAQIFDYELEQKMRKSGRVKS